MNEALRYNDGKLRYDLLHPYAIEQLAEIFTFGAKKYAPNNWQKGMPWSKILASLKRHLAAIERGEDYDPESGLLHSAHVEWNAHALTAYYKIYPQGDDRNHKYLKPKKIGLDIDGVLANFQKHVFEYLGQQAKIVTHWDDPNVRDNYEIVKKDPQFWLSIPPLISPKDIIFSPHCYITARSIDPKVTQEWLDKNGFPKATLYCVGSGESKIETAKKSGIELFVDDHYVNFVDLTNAGIFTYLMDAPYNHHYDVGHRRVKSLKEVC
jgi:hypothetical protein